MALRSSAANQSPKFSFLRSGAKLHLELGTEFAAKWQGWVGGLGCVQGGREKRKSKNHRALEMAQRSPH